MPDPEQAGHGLAAYRRVLAVPQVAALAAASVFARLPSGMASVALILYVHGETGSFAAAGAVAAAFTIGLSLSGPPLARLIDRRGSRFVALPGALIAALALAAVVALGDRGAGTVELSLAAVLAGGASPPFSGLLRRRWPELVSAHDLPTIYAVDSILIETVFVLGPLLAGILAATAGPGPGLLVAAGLGLVGAIWFLALVSVGPSPRPAVRHGWTGPLTSPTMRLLVLTGLPLGAAFGALEVALPAFGNANGNAALGGFFAATISVGSVIGGFLYGARPHRLGPPARAFLVLTVAQSVACVPLVAASTIPEMFLFSALAGVCVAPLMTVRNQLAQKAMPAGTATESFTWMTLSVTLGLSAGAALSGPLVESAGWRAAAAAAALIPALGAALLFYSRGTLQIAEDEEPGLAPAPARGSP